MWKDYAASIGSTVSALTKQQKIEAEVAGLRQESIYQTGDAARMTETYAGKTAALGAAFTSLKVAVGNVFMPILQKIIPVITQVVNWLTALATRAAQVVQILFGVKVSAGGMQAVADSTNAAADAQNNLAGSTERAGKAAKGALAPFDELNVLSQDTGGSGEGGGVSAPDIGGVAMEEGQSALDGFDEKLSNIKDKLIALFAPAEEPFNRLKEQVLELGGKIWDGLKWVWNNILVPIGEWAITDALPAFLYVLEGAVDVLNTTIDTLKPLGKWLWEEFLKPMGEWVGEAIIHALKLMAEKLTALSDWISNHQEATENLAIIFGAIGIAILAVATALGIYSAAAAVAAAITGVITAPILIAIAVIAALIAIVILVVKYWDNIKAAGVAVWEWMKQAWADIVAWVSQALNDIGQFFVNIWEWIKTAVSVAWQWVMGIFATVRDWFLDNVVNPIMEIFGPLFEFIGIIAHDAWMVIQYVWALVKDWFNEKVVQPLVEFFTELWESIKTLAENAWNKIVEVWTIVSTWFNDNIITPLTNFFTELWDGIVGFATSAWDKIKGIWQAVSSWWQEHVTGPLTDAWEDFTGWLSEKWNSIWDAIASYLKGIINGIIGVLNDMLSSVFGGINKIIAGVNTLGGVIPGWKDIPEITVPQIPKLATGAVIPANAPFAAILGDQRSGTNIETPETLLRQIMREEMAGMGNAGQDITINFAGSFGALIREMKPYIDKENVRIGRSMVRGLS